MLPFLNKREKGKLLEKQAADYLVKHGYKLVELNFYCKLGEIDIIAQNGSELIFVEVRHRKSKQFGGAIESVDYKKQQKLIKTALHYLQQNKLIDKVACRFDVVAFEGTGSNTNIHWIKNAFQLS